MPTDATAAVKPRSIRDLDLHPIVQRFVEAARQQFGDRLEAIVLYGSRARGDHRPDSDYDIAIFVGDLDNAYTEYAELADIAGGALADDDVEISGRLHSADIWRDNSSPLMREIRRDGVAL